MLSVQQQQQQQQQGQQQFVPEINTIENNFRATEKDEDFYFLSQHLNLPGLLMDEQEEEYPSDYFNPPTNFEIANRAFYATINKFTRQSCPDASRRRSPPYSFLENWHLHSIYSKSQQTLLGITPVRPSVLLSGDDFMFTPPFIPQEQENIRQEECYDQDWNQIEETKSEYYNLSPCPDSNGTITNYNGEEEEDLIFETLNHHDKPFVDYNNHHSQENIWLENDQRTHNLNLFNSHHHHHLPIHIQQNDDLLSLQHNIINENEEEEEEELYTTDSSSSSADDQRCSSEDEEDNSCYNIANLYDLEEESTKQDVVQPISPMTRSSSFLSQKSSSSSVMSYQSLADIMSNNMNCFEERNNNNYGSTINNYNNPQLPIADNDNYARNYDDDIELGTQHNVRTTWADSFIYFIHIWQFLVLWASKLIPCIKKDQEEREPLL